MSAAPLVSVEEVRSDSGLSGATRLDVRWELAWPPRAGRRAYLDGHIPGAAFIDLETALAGPPGEGGRHPLPAAGDFEAAMRAAGVSGERPVIVYDGGNSIAAARAWWLLRYFGHAQVSVLDGGFSGWLAAGLAIERGATAPGLGDFMARAGGMPLLDAAGAARLVAGGGVLLDARAPERFRGESEPIDPVAGHIPGAVNVPSPSLLDATGHFLDPVDLRRRFEAAGAGEGVGVGAYCGSGITAAHEVLGLEVAGFSGAALYVGSWSEWITDPERPVAVGG
ncbi:MAG TPA: sulfurtransferase [Solirubrobacteraceae bacterium]|nr:sulfurtransferase [Solirubrobacteraceae bacterium]